MSDRRPASERLDEAVEALMADRDPSSPLSPRLTALLEVAADLRDLPRADFKATLGSALRAVAGPSYGPVLATEADIEARLAALAGPPRLVAHDLRAALRDMPELTMRFLARLLAPLGTATVALSRFATQMPLWERHPAGDELLHVLEGTLDVTTLTDEGPVRTTVEAGSLFVCQRGLWHWPRPRGTVALLSITPSEGSEHSHVDDPRVGATPSPSTPSSSAIASDLPTALHDLPALTITRATSEAEANAAVRTVGRLDDRMLGVMRFAGETPWERHADGDELLHVLDGEVDVTLLTDTGPVHVTVPAGSVLVCPRGLWHRQRPKTTATLFFATPTASSEASWADDPRA